MKAGKVVDYFEQTVLVVAGEVAVSGEEVRVVEEASVAVPVGKPVCAVELLVVFFVVAQVYPVLALYPVHPVLNCSRI